jgi:hypothetical protein
MTITLDLQPDVERGLLDQAQLRGVSLQDYVQQIVTREAHLSAPVSPTRQAANLVELSEPVRGLLTDGEIDTIFSRNPSTSRLIDLS